MYVILCPFNIFPACSFLIGTFIFHLKMAKILQFTISYFKKMDVNSIFIL